MSSLHSDIEEKLKILIEEFLHASGVDYNHRRLYSGSSIQRDLGIDSLGRAELFQRIEKKFNIQLPDALMAEAETLYDIINAINISQPGHISSTQHKIQTPLEKSIINPGQAETLVDVLLLYATDDPDRPHIYLQNEHGEEQTITYGTLFENALRVAYELLNKGLKSGDRVAIMLPTQAEFFYTFFGVLLINCIPVPIYPPFRLHQIEAYAKQEAKILHNAEVRILITFQQVKKLSQILRAFVPSLKEVITVDVLLQSTGKAPFPTSKAEHPAMIQYTSGSTSTPKGVLLSHYNLLSNIRAYGEAIQISHYDAAVSWVPLYHDLGLIGMWLGSLYHGISLTLMSPLTFLNRPERWLWAIHSHQGTISGGPNFAYELCIRKIDPELIEGLNLSSWRIAFNGAEPIQPKTLERFTKKFSSYGFRHQTHLPVYGLAESSVCIAISPLHRGPRVDMIERKAFEENNQAIPTTDEDLSLQIVACGTPIPHHSVRIVDEENHVLTERHVGLLQFKGPSSMQGYYNNLEATLAIYHEGWWDTGDLAYIADGEIFITGRKKDIIIKAGRNIYPSEIEEIIGQLSHIRKGCIIAFGVTDPKRGTEKLIIVAETRDKKPISTQTIINEINAKISDILDLSADEVILVPPHTVPKTSSGKLQRTACKNLFLNGKLLQHHVPFWVQMTKISMNFGLAKIKRVLGFVGKVFYSCYIYLLIAITLIPIYLSLWILPQHLVARLCKAWARSLFFLGFCPITLIGKEELSHQKSIIYTANHASYIDGILLLAFLPAGTLFIGKQELSHTPIIRRFMRKLNFLTVDRMNIPKGLEDTQLMEDALKAGSSIAIFPEGTFTSTPGLKPFKLGAFKIAAESNTPICPISIKGSRFILRGDERLFKPGPITLTINPLVIPEGKEWQDITALKNKISAFIKKDAGEPFTYL